MKAHLDNVMQAIFYSLGSVAASLLFPEIMISDESMIEDQLKIVVLILQIAGLIVALFAAIYKLWKEIYGTYRKKGKP